MTIKMPEGETPRRDGLAWWYKPPTVQRLYVDTRFGQMHLRMARPPGSPTARIWWTCGRESRRWTVPASRRK